MGYGRILIVAQAARIGKQRKFSKI